MRQSWTYDKLKDALEPICEAMGRFPSHSELRSVGRSDIACQVSRRGGSIAIAKDMGYPRRLSDSDFGWLGESQCRMMLESEGFSVTKPEGVKSPYDLLVGGLVRVDVKAANWSDYGRSRGWFYREDYPRRDDENWLKWVFAKKAGKKMKIWAEPVPEEYQGDKTLPYEVRYPLQYGEE